MNVEIKLKQAKSFSDFIRKTDGSLALYQTYFHQLAPSGLQLRVITPESNIKWIESEVNKGKVWVMKDRG